jgi:inward rectifier potassium channel
MKMNIFRKFKEYNDTGFSTRADKEPYRLINQDGTLNVRREGLSFFDHFSFFHELVKMRWITFNLIVVLSYFMINTFFGIIYWSIGVKHLGLNATGSHWHDFLNSLFFSAQTFSTVGYGRVNPVSPLANFIAMFEMLIGMMYIALAAGLLFARFSRPVSKVIYSNKAIIAPYKEGKGLMFRISNAKKNLLLNVSVRVFLTMKIKENNIEVRKFTDLELERKQIDMLTMSWTIVHPIDQNSPLFRFEQNELEGADAEFLVLVNGINDTFSQPVHSRTSYKFNEVVWDARFEPIFEVINGKTIVSLDKLSKYFPVKESLP